MEKNVGYSSLDSSSCFVNTGTDLPDGYAPGPNVAGRRHLSLAGDTFHRHPFYLHAMQSLGAKSEKKVTDVKDVP